MTDLKRALDAARSYRATAQAALAKRLAAKHIDADQRAAHGFAWIATYVAALRQMRRWAESGHNGELEQLILQAAFGEYLAQVFGGIPMNQGEFIRLAELGLTRGETAGLHDLVLLERGNTAEAVADLEAYLAHSEDGLDLDLIADRLSALRNANG